MRRSIVLVMLSAVAVLAGAGLAPAADRIACTGGLCTGTSGDDLLKGTAARDELYADAGADTLRGRATGDELRGEEGDDDLDGGAGSDTYYYDDVWDKDRLTGDRSGPKDWLVFFYPSTSQLQVDLRPRPGQNEVVLGSSSINFARNVEIEWVQAGAGIDEVKGTAADNYFLGGDLGDTLVGRGGRDQLVGDIDVFTDVGDDTLRGGSGKDELDGGPGDDTILAKDDQRDQIKCGGGTDTVKFDEGLDHLAASCEV